MAAEGTITRLADPSVSTVAWSAKRELPFSEWVLQGRRLGILSRGAQWWVGDWLAYGNRHYGETYAKAARITGYDVHSLMNMAYVASRFQISRRRENVSWSHHATLAALAPEEQDVWLDRIARDRLSVSCLRIELRAWSGETSASSGGDDSGAEPGAALAAAHPVSCPACGHSFELAPDAGAG